jgi:Epoxide hydrolase N terminus
VAQQGIVSDASQGVQLATMQKLADYWANQYDWRKVEARLHALPQFATNIDGVDIHFIHVRSKQTKALPLILTHGWPGSIMEELKVIDPLTNPTAHVLYQVAKQPILEEQMSHDGTAARASRCVINGSKPKTIQQRPRRWKPPGNPVKSTES